MAFVLTDWTAAEAILGTRPGHVQGGAPKRIPFSPGPSPSFLMWPDLAQRRV